MANKNHSLDGLIEKAAFDEFMENGYEKASMRKIAAGAGVTIGAIYTRYKTKDDLFRSLAKPLTDRIENAFGLIKEQYHSGGASPSSMKESMQKESEAILHLLFDDYKRAVLLLCRSQGSSLEGFFGRIVDRKIEETLLFFKAAGAEALDENILRLFISSQFHMYFQIINEGLGLDEARKMMNAAVIYNTGGWLALMGAGEI